MNIHFTNKELFNNLKHSTIHSQLVGSHLYDLNDENSDTDKLLVYVDTFDNYLSVNWSHHQLQYISKDERTDYNFCDVKLFVRNILTGDSTVSFETLWTEDFSHSDLSWMLHFREDFINYNIIKSYLGLAKRDLKIARKLTSNFTKEHIDANARKRIVHVVRGITFAKKLMNDEFELVHHNKLLKSIKSGEMDFLLKEITDNVENEMNTLRSKLQSLHDNKQIELLMDSTRMKQLDDKLKQYIHDNLSTHNIDYDNLFYNVIHKNIAY